MFAISIVALAIGAAVFVAVAVVSLALTPGRQRRLRDGGAMLPVERGGDDDGLDL